MKTQRPRVLLSWRTLSLDRALCPGSLKGALKAVKAGPRNRDSEFGGGAD